MSLAQVQLLAAKSIDRVAKGENLDKALVDLQQEANLTIEERAALKDLSFGCQRYLGTLTFYLHNLVTQKRPAPEIDHLLLVALYQLAYSRTPEHVVVNEAVNLAKTLLDGQYKGLVNGVLRNFLRNKDVLSKKTSHQDEAKYNHPKWLVERLKKEHPKYWHNILKANQSHPPMTLRVNCQKMDAESYMAILKEEGIDAKQIGAHSIQLKKALPISKLPEFSSGGVSVQDDGAQQAALLLAPKQGDRVLDACAAPGGKTGHLLELANCQLTALDVDEERLQKVAENLARLGFEADLKCADASRLANWYNGAPFDLVLADVPCSASGIIRRHPDIKWLRQTQDAKKLAGQQTVLLDALWQTVKPKGKMLLATCSIFSEENQEQTERFLLRHPDAKLLLEKNLLPCDQNDGFYYALMQKI